MSGPRRPDERGFTLPELVVVVVLLGLIVAPLSTALTEAITLVPDAGSRSATAAGEDRLTLNYSDDVAQTQSVVYVALAAQPCPTAAGSPVSLVGLQWSNNGTTSTVVYTLKFPGGGGQLQNVEVHRLLGTTSDTTYFTAYCTPGVWVAQAGKATTPSGCHVSLLLNLKETPSSATRVIALDSATRVTGVTGC